MALSTMSWASLRRQIVILTGVLLFAFAVAALIRPEPAVSGSDWTVLATQGEAKWREDAGQGTWRHLTRNARLPDGSEIRTGSDGRAVVAKGLDRIEIRAESTLVVAARVTARGATEVDQSRGSATYTIEKRPAGTFSVRTPYVVAVVKGTQFSVDIGEEETNVSVDEGRVSVSDQRSRDSVDVTPGQTARASRNAAGIDVGETPAGAKPQSAVPNAAPTTTTTTAPTTAPATDAKVGAEASPARGSLGGAAADADSGARGNLDDADNARDRAGPDLDKGSTEKESAGQGATDRSDLDRGGLDRGERDDGRADKAVGDSNKDISVGDREPAGASTASDGE
ncbi:FecR domain-containing protein [Pelagibius sp.]|uniref:FecR family protein n=1 Tax=Pelagibius sp. TaxID=1931238 RepID=UPI00261DE806|nr:FecR family protein [Pelagibius sp.]